MHSCIPARPSEHTRHNAYTMQLILTYIYLSPRLACARSRRRNLRFPAHPRAPTPSRRRPIALTSGRPPRHSSAAPMPQWMQRRPGTSPRSGSARSRGRRPLSPPATGRYSSDDASRRGVARVPWRMRCCPGTLPRSGSARSRGRRSRDGSAGCRLRTGAAPHRRSRGPPSHCDPRGGAAYIGCPAVSEVHAQEANEPLVVHVRVAQGARFLRTRVHIRMCIYLRAHMGIICSNPLSCRYIIDDLLHAHP